MQVQIAKVLDVNLLLKREWLPQCSSCVNKDANICPVSSPDVLDAVLCYPVVAAVVLAQRAAPQEPLAREADGGEEEKT